MKVNIHAGDFSGVGAAEVTQLVARGWSSIAPDDITTFVAGSNPTDVGAHFGKPIYSLSATDFRGHNRSLDVYRTPDGVYLDGGGLLDPEKEATKNFRATQIGAGTTGLGAVLGQLVHEDHIILGVGESVAVDGGKAMFSELGENATTIAKKTTVLVDGDRPLLGLDGTSSDVRGITEEDNWLAQEESKKISFFFRDLEHEFPRVQSPTETLLPINVGRVKGSGMGGGCVASLLQLGAQMMSTASFLSSYISLGKRDIDVVFERYLHPQTIGKSWLAHVAENSYQNGTVVVAVAEESSLSRHELSSWGIQGLFVTQLNPRQIGIRLARTWSPNRY